MFAILTFFVIEFIIKQPLLAKNSAFNFRKPYWKNNNVNLYDPWLSKSATPVLVKEVKLSCTPKQFLLVVEFTKEFYGAIYSKNYFFSHNNCKLVGNGTRIITYELSFDGCGTRKKFDKKKEEFYENIIVIKMEKDWPILTTSDQGFHIKCWPQKFVTEKEMEREKKLKVPALKVPLKSKKMLPIPMPKCTMKIVKGTDPLNEPIEKLIIGETGTVVISLENNVKHEVFIKDCISHDGYKDVTFELIDKDGCPAIEKFVQPIKVFHNEMDNNSYFFFHFNVFKFPDTDNVYFKCHITLCLGRCKNKQCDRDRQIRQRGRRDLYEDEYTKDFLDENILDVTYVNLTDSTLVKMGPQKNSRSDVSMKLISSFPQKQEMDTSPYLMNNEIFDNDTCFCPIDQKESFEMTRFSFVSSYIIGLLLAIIIILVMVGVTWIHYFRKNFSKKSIDDELKLKKYLKYPTSLWTFKKGKNKRTNLNNINYIGSSDDKSYTSEEKAMYYDVKEFYSKKNGKRRI